MIPFINVRLDNSYLIAVFAAKENASVYGLAIIAGIVFSLMGAVALMLPKKQIIVGMGAFLVVHVAYIVSFSLLLIKKRIR